MRPASRPSTTMISAPGRTCSTRRTCRPIRLSPATSTRALGPCDFMRRASPAAGMTTLRRGSGKGHPLSGLLHHPVVAALPGLLAHRVGRGVLADTNGDQRLGQVNEQELFRQAQPQVVVLDDAQLLVEAATG